jgi:hypothetical protein
MCVGLVDIYIRFIFVRQEVSGQIYHIIFREMGGELDIGLLMR